MRTLLQALWTVTSMVITTAVLGAWFTEQIYLMFRVGGVR